MRRDNEDFVYINGKLLEPNEAYPTEDGLYTHHRYLLSPEEEEKLDSVMDEWMKRFDQGNPPRPNANLQEWTKQPLYITSPKPAQPGKTITMGSWSRLMAKENKRFRQNPVPVYTQEYMQVAPPPLVNQPFIPSYRGERVWMLGYGNINAVRKIRFPGEDSGLDLNIKEKKSLLERDRKSCAPRSHEDL